MLKKLLMVVATSALASTAFADDAARTEAKQVIDLKDGTTLYIFKDGKMAMEDKFGRTMRMKKDTVMETKDGQKIIMHGDEVARLDTLLRQGHEGG
ncbi:MAG: periplasmic Cu(I)/Cu(II)-binding protein CopK [Rhodocyclaceae bacterium]